MRLLALSAVIVLVFILTGSKGVDGATLDAATISANSAARHRSYLATDVDAGGRLTQMREEAIANFGQFLQDRRRALEKARIAERQKREAELASKLKEQEESSKGRLVGSFKITHYCTGSCCNGQWAGQTATGATPEVGVTIAVDPKVIPLGNRVYIEGYGSFVAQDTGGAIKGSKIDVLVGSHAEAMRKGVVYRDVYVY